jgi:SRSO17 transposase
MDHRVEDRREDHAISSPWFQRRAPRAWAQKDLHGRLLALPRQAIAPLVFALEGPTAKAVRTMPRFLSEGPWQDEGLLHRHWQEVDTALGEEDGGRSVDGRDVLQQGQESVGVHRQSCGAVGKRANGHAGVAVGSASRRGDPVLARRLYWPQAWGADAGDAARRRTCGGAQAITFTTQPRWGGR